MRPGFWSEPVRVWLNACGRQDIVDRGDALAQRVTALLVAVRQRVDQYLDQDDLYSGAAGRLPPPADPGASAAVLADLDEFVNVRLREEIDALEKMLSVFDDLRSRPPSASAHEVCERLSSSLSDDNVAGFVVGAGADGKDTVLALTVTDPGPGAAGLVIDGHPFAVARAPRSLRRRIFSGSSLGAPRLSRSV